jgi:hypothetical protein
MLYDSASAGRIFARGGRGRFHEKHLAMSVSDRVRCENLGCLCDIPIAEKACSEYCDSLEGRDPHNVRCTCGHKVCAEQTEHQLHGGAGKESS